MTKYLRKSLEGFVNYPPAPQEGGHILNANEAPSSIIERYGDQISQALISDLHRYPDPLASEVRDKLAAYVGARPEEVLVTSGGDEGIKLVMEALVEPGQVILTHSPSFSMYEISGTIRGARMVKVQDLPGFRIDVEGLIRAAQEEDPALIILCVPNNPTGQALTREEVQRIIESTQAPILLDGAYMEFAQEDLTDLYSDRVLVLRTLSKAFGLAGARLGYLVSSEALIGDITLVKPPYNTTRTSQVLASLALDLVDEVRARVEMIKRERDSLVQALNKIEGVQALESQGNFVLARTKRKDRVRENLAQAGLLLKDYGPGLLEDYFRISVVGPEENAKIEEAFKI